MQPSLLNFTATACQLLGIEPPDLATLQPLESVISAAHTLLGDQPVEKLLIYAPDALGRQILRRYPEHTQRIMQHAPIEVELHSVYPSVTPVCFASLFTGASPEDHGIKRYEKRALTCDTLIDALTRAGKRVALVVPQDCSMAVLFEGRGKQLHPSPPWLPDESLAQPGLSAFIVQYDPQVTWCALKLLEHCDFDVLIAYHMQYDDLLHLTEPFSEECLLACQLHVVSFESLCAAVDQHWVGQHRAVCFTPDHGAHFSIEKQMGWHGTDQSEDMELLHFWGIKPG